MTLDWSVTRIKETKRRTSKGCWNTQGLTTAEQSPPSGQWPLGLLKRVHLWRNVAFFIITEVNPGGRREQFSVPFCSWITYPFLEVIEPDQRSKGERIQLLKSLGLQSRMPTARDRFGLVFCQFLNKVSKVWLFCAPTSRQLSLSQDTRHSLYSPSPPFIVYPPSCEFHPPKWTFTHWLSHSW